MKTEKGELSASRETDLQSFETQRPRYGGPDSALEQGLVSDIPSDLSIELRRLGVRMSSSYPSDCDVFILDDSRLRLDSRDSAEICEVKVDRSEDDLTAVVKSGEQSYSKLLAQAMTVQSPSLGETERVDTSLVQLSDSPSVFPEDLKGRRSFSCDAKMLESQLLPYRNTTVFDESDFCGNERVSSIFTDLRSEENQSDSESSNQANLNQPDFLGQNLDSRPNDPLEVDLCALSHDESRQIDSKYTSKRLYCSVCIREVYSVVSFVEESPNL